jgi:4-amino-4-deoxy-L-arabinose transferase-like glycosyltransferase
MRNEKIILGIIILASVVLRLGAALYLGDEVIDMPGTADQISYHTLATRILGGYGFSFGEPWWPATAAGASTAHWSYPYTFFLVLVYSLFGPHPIVGRLIQVVLVGILHPYFAYLIGRRVFNSTTGLLAAGITALYTYFIYYTAALMTEPFYILFILTSLYLAILLADRMAANNTPGDRSGRPALPLAALLGASLGLTVLFRQVFLLFIPFLYIWLWLANKTKLTKQLLVSYLVSGIVTLMFLLPFTVYNYLRFDRFVLVNTNAGFAFYWANHPIYGDRFIPILPAEMGSYQQLLPEDVRHLNEAEMDQALLRHGIQFVLDDPVRYLRLSLSRIPAYFMFWPAKESGLISNVSRLAGFGVFLPFMMYGLVRSVVPRPPVAKLSLGSPVLLLMLFILVYSAIHILTWALIRYRLPVDAVLVVFAALAIYDLAGRLGTWFKSSRSYSGVSNPV